MSLLFYWASIFIVYFFTGGTFETVLGGTIKPLLSHLQILPHFSFPIEVQWEEMRQMIMIKVILEIFGVAHSKPLLSVEFHVRSILRYDDAILFFCTWNLSFYIGLMNCDGIEEILGEQMEVRGVVGVGSPCLLDQFIVLDED